LTASRFLKLLTADGGGLASSGTAANGHVHAKP
jgi:hypothetical protein